MPTYEYQCASCGHQLESFQKITDAPLTNCPKCHQETLNKLISASAFQLKGTGWYATDFRDKGKPKPTDKEKEGEGGSGKAESHESTSKETKPNETKTKDTQSKDATSKNTKPTDPKSSAKFSEK